MINLANLNYEQQVGVFVVLVTVFIISMVINIRLDEQIRKKKIERAKEILGKIN